MNPTLSDGLLFSNRVALVVGGTRGIGAACARILASAGATVVLTGTDRARAEREAQHLAADYGVKAAGIALNLNDYASIGATIKSIAAEYNGIDALVLSAGVMQSTPLV